METSHWAEWVDGRSLVKGFRRGVWSDKVILEVMTEVAFLQVGQIEECRQSLREQPIQGYSSKGLQSNPAAVGRDPSFDELKDAAGLHNGHGVAWVEALWTSFKSEFMNVLLQTF